MIYNIYSVMDVNLGYGAPIIQDNDAVAMRSFQNGCCDKSSVWYTHCADFYLYCIGTFDSDSGELVSVAPRKVCGAFDFVNMIKERENEY